MNKEQELQAELKRFAYAVSHDLQSPLRLITSYLQLIQRHLPQDDPKLQDFVNEALAGSQDMSSYINDLLQYSRVVNADYTPESFNITKLLSLELMKRQMKDENMVVTLDESTPFMVLAMKDQIKKLIEHLIDNAVKFRTEDQNLHISIDIQEVDNNIQIGIADNGIGIDGDNLSRVFELYRQLHPKSQYPGNGMGLAISQKIIALNKGKIWATSAKGGGATLWFTLPKM